MTSVSRSAAAPPSPVGSRPAPAPRVGAADDDLYEQPKSSKVKTVAEGADLGRWGRCYDVAWDLLSRALRGLWWFGRWMCSPLVAIYKGFKAAGAFLRRARAERALLSQKPIDEQSRILAAHLRQAREFALQAIHAKKTFKEASKHLKLTPEVYAMHEKAYSDLVTETVRGIKDTADAANNVLNEIEAAGYEIGDASDDAAAGAS